MTHLRFGTFLAPNMLPTYQAIADAVGRRLDASVELVIETDYENCVNDVNDVCFVCSLPYILYERQGRSPAVPVAAPILIGERYGGRPVYFSDVIVHRSNPAASFFDLRGASWAYNEPMSQSGYGITRYHLVSIGETDGFFGEVIEAGFHETSIQMVRNGKVDASAIDSQVLSVAMRDDPSLAAEIRVIDSLGPSTIQPIAVTKRFAPQMRDAIRAALVDVHNELSVRHYLERGFIERISPIGPEDYDDIRQMLEACEAAGFLELR
jgi:phosphonate transport system substrate-binding protein